MAKQGITRIFLSVERANYTAKQLADTMIYEAS